MRCSPTGVAWRTKGARVGVTSSFRQKRGSGKRRGIRRVIRTAAMRVSLPRSLVKTAPFPLAAALCAATVAGCSAAPSQSILGSYFPTWMICALIGLVVTVVLRQVFATIGVDRTLPAPLLVYLAIAIAASFATWLIWLDRA
jgi:hypothetical protein